MPPLFKGVKYFMPMSISPERMHVLKVILEDGGATEADDPTEATHIISNTDRFVGYHELPDEQPPVVVTELWVERSAMLSKLLPTSHFSADEAMLFSGVTATATEDVPRNDSEVLMVGITALGGVWRGKLTHDVTHVFALGRSSMSYAVAFEHQKQYGGSDIKILLPHWFDDVMRIGHGSVATDRYEWPDPPLLNTLNDEHLDRKSHKVDPLKKTLFKSAAAADSDLELPDVVKRELWNNSRFLISSDLNLSKERRNAIETHLENTKGIIIRFNYPHQEQELVDQCDIYITKYRSGKAYFKAAKAHKTIGNLNWLFHVLSNSTVTPPINELLHYPFPRRSADGMQDQCVAITNYTGEGREYLKKLVEAMGGQFSANMTAKNTVLVAAFPEGAKYDKAHSWNIPVVHHIWLEDCFIKWQHIHPANSRYIEFQPGMNYSSHLAEKCIPKIIEDPDELLKAEAEDEAYLEAIADANNLAPIDVDIVGPMDRHSMPPPPTPTKTPSRVSKSTKKSASKLKSTPAKPISVIELLDDDPGPGPSSINKRKRVIGVEEEPEQNSIVVEKTSPVAGSSKEKPSKGPRKSTRCSEVATPREPSPRETPAPPLSTPRRVPSVIVPHMKTSPLSARSKVATRLERATSIHITANERRNPSRTVSPIKASQKSESPKIKKNPSSPMGAPPPSSPKLRRSAAARASQKLHDEIMPDVLKHQQELKSRSRRSIGTDLSNQRKRAADSDAESDEASSRVVKKSRTSLKGKQKLDMSDHEEQDIKPSVTTDKKKARVNGKIIIVDDETEATKSKAKPLAKSQKGAASTPSRAPTKAFRLMTTQVDLSDSVYKALAKLGAKLTTRPAECTHLIAKSIVRTEKFLCALAVAPYIVSERWATESAKAEELLSEDEYALKDDASEEKYNFKLADALERSRNVEGKLLKGKGFFVTSKASTNNTLLKNVILACGGEVVKNTPTHRALKTNPNRYVISCIDDISIWRFLAPEHPIYSPELILSGALKQQIEWDNPAFRVQPAT